MTEQSPEIDGFVARVEQRLEDASGDAPGYYDAAIRVMREEADDA